MCFLTKRYMQYLRAVKTRSGIGAFVLTSTVVRTVLGYSSIIMLGFAGVSGRGVWCVGVREDWKVRRKSFCSSVAFPFRMTSVARVAQGRRNLAFTPKRS